MKHGLLFLIILFSLSVSAQERNVRDDFFREAEQSRNDFKKEWRQSKQDYIAFRNQANLEYIENLKQAWKEFAAYKKIPQPKDDTVPPIIYEGKEEQEQESKEVPVVEVVPVVKTQPQPEPIAPIIENNLADNTIEISLYQTKIAVRVPKDHTIHLAQLSENSIVDAWGKLSGEDFSNLIHDCLNARKSLALSDWAYIKFLQLVSEKLYGKSNEAVLLQAYIYAQSGYSMRLAYGNKNRLYLLVESQYELYELSYFVISKRKFYPLNCEEQQLFISDAGFQTEKAMSLQIPYEQKFQYTPSKSKEYTSREGMKVKCEVNINDIDFYNTYPTGQLGEDFGTRWATYANVPMNKKIRDTFYPQIKLYLTGLSEKESVGKILNWVQTSFEYKKDDLVWGHDRAFFPSETLYYPYCDCEDRSILFSRIVRDVLHLDVVLLYYPGHLATAVHFNEDVKGDYLMVKGKKYIVCDPTYIGAPVGDTMPNMNNQSAKVIVLN